MTEGAEMAGAEPPRWWQGAGFWRAAAGMAAAAALGCAIMAAEFSGTLIFRSRNYHRRIAALNSVIQRMGRELDAARKEKRTAFAAGRQSAEDALIPILTAPERRTIKLSRPESKVMEGQPRLAPSSAATLTISDKQGKALLRVEGLPIAPQAMTYRVFWLAKNGGVLRTDDFTPGPDGDGAVVMVLSEPRPYSVLVTVEPAGGAPTPSGPVAFKGRIAP